MYKSVPKKLLDNIYLATPLGVFANIVLAFLGVLVFWHQDSDAVLIWFTILVGVMLYRLYLYRLYIHKRVGGKRAFLLYYIGVLASALVWIGLLWMNRNDASVAHQFFIIYILAGITAAAIISFSAMLIVYISYAAIMAFGVIGWLLTKEDGLYGWMVGATLIYLLFLVINAKRLNELFLHSLLVDEERKEALKSLTTSNEQLRLILDNAPVGIFFFDKELNIKRVNDFLVRFLDVNKEELLRLNLSKLKDKRIVKLLKDVVENGKVGTYEGSYTTYLSNKNIEIRLLVSPVYDGEREIIGGLGIVEDIAEEIAYKKRMERFAQFYLQNPNPVFQIDCASRKIVLENESSSIIRRFYDEWDKLIERICTTKEDRIEVYIQNKIYQLNLVRLDEGIVNVYAQDITAEKEARKKADFYAYYDELTELPRKKLFVEFLKDSIQKAKRARKHNALLFIDLDDFKMINDTFGHGTGDRFLKILANRLKYSIRKSDIIARLGGDEFAVLLGDLSGDKAKAKKEALAIAQKILESIKMPVFVENLKFESSASIGVVVFQDADLDEIFKDADIAMYEAKSLGKDRIFLFDEVLRKKIATKNILIDQLNRALTLEEFELFLQPQIELKSEKIKSAEALLRWRHPEEGLLYPEYFIASAEESGLIVDLDLWVLKNAYDLTKRFRELSYIGVNVSVRSFVNPRFHTTIQEWVKEGRLEPKAIEIELTERLIVEDYFSADSQIRRLKELGFRFAIDDFGTGYSSLSYIKNLSIDTLKIDRAFIKDLGVHKSGEVLTRIILEIAKNFHMQSVAEGVENELQLHFLSELGCDLVQGYYYAKALSVEEFEEFIKNYRQS